MCSQIDDDISLHPGVIRGNPELQSLKSHSGSRQAAWDLFPNCNPRSAVILNFPVLFKFGCLSKPSLLSKIHFCSFYFSFGGSDGKVSVYNAEDPGSIPGLGRSSGERNGNPLQYSCLENPMDGEAW